MPKEELKDSPARNKPGTMLRISVRLGAMAPEERIKAKKNAREGAVISLWRAGSLSTREAAAELDLGYYDYIDLLGKLGVPVLTEVSDEPILGDALEEIQRARALRSQ